MITSKFQMKNEQTEKGSHLIFTECSVNARPVAAPV